MVGTGESGWVAGSGADEGKWVPLSTLEFHRGFDWFWLVRVEVEDAEDDVEDDFEVASVKERKRERKNREKKDRKSR